MLSQSRPIKAFFSELRQYFRDAPGRVWRAAILVIALLISVWVGVRYYDEAYIQLFPILTWLYAILMAFGALYPKQCPALFQVRLNRTWGGILLLLTAAFILRTFNLVNFPPGFHGDESGSVEFALAHAFNPQHEGLTIHPLRSGLDSQPVFFSYILWLSVKLFGPTITGARMIGIMVGSLAVVGTFLVVDEISDRKTAWFSAILMTAYHYHIHWSRVALSNIWVTLLLPLAIGLFLRGWRLGRGSGAVWAGVCLGLTAYLYTGGYVLVFLLGVVILQTWRGTPEKTRFIIYTGRMLILATVIAAPLMIFAYLKPDHFFDRLTVIFGWSSAAITTTLDSSATYWDYFIYQITHSFGAYNYYSDVTGFYAPQTPFLIGISSPLFLAGIVLSLYQRKIFPFLWVVFVTFLGGVMTVGTPSSSHFIPVIPALCWLVAIPIKNILETKWPYVAYLLLAGILLTDLNFYFVIYTSSPSYDFRLTFPTLAP